MNNIIGTKLKRTKNEGTNLMDQNLGHKCDVPQIIGPIFSVSKYKS